MAATSVVVIQAHGLAKAYGATRALSGVDLEVRAGTVRGLLGPNGAGKTTTVRILATLLRPSAGHAQVAGCRPGAGRCGGRPVPAAPADRAFRRRPGADPPALTRSATPGLIRDSRIRIRPSRRSP